MDYPIEKCRCGYEARLRHKANYTWVSCKRKGCSMHSGFVHKMENGNQEEIDKFAIDLWNGLVKKNG